MNSRGLSPALRTPSRPSFRAAQASVDALEPTTATTRKFNAAAETVAAAAAADAISPAAAALETLESPVTSPRAPQEHQEEQEKVLAASRQRRSQHPVTPGAAGGKREGAERRQGGEESDTREAVAVGGLSVERAAGESDTGRAGAVQSEGFREGKGTTPANGQEQKVEEKALVETAVTTAAAAAVIISPRTPTFHPRPLKAAVAASTAEALPASPLVARSAVAAPTVVPSPVAAIAAAVATAAAAPAAVLLEGVMAVARSARPAGRRRQRRQNEQRRSTVVEANWAGDRSCVLTVGLRYHLSTFDAQGLADMLNSREESTEQMAGTKASFFPPRQVFAVHVLLFLFSVDGVVKVFYWVMMMRVPSRRFILVFHLVVEVVSSIVF